MQILSIKQYTISLYGKEDGDAKISDHETHMRYVSVNQQHVPVVYERTWEETAGQSLDVHADAIIARVDMDSGIWVYMADCNNIAVLWDTFYAVVHGSRKTLHAWLLEKTISRLFELWEDAESVHIFIWPSIRVDAYEVGNEFHELFDSSFLPEYADRIHLDMVAYILHILQKFDINSTCITLHDDCTYQRNDLRWSYRAGEVGRRNFLWVSVSPVDV